LNSDFPSRHVHWGIVGYEGQHQGEEEEEEAIVDSKPPPPPPSHTVAVAAQKPVAAPSRFLQQQQKIEREREQQRRLRAAAAQQAAEDGADSRERAESRDRIGGSREPSIDKIVNAGLDIVHKMFADGFQKGGGT
jgi:hypothetical protein